VGVDQLANEVLVRVVQPDDRARALIRAIAGPEAPVAVEEGVLFR
jgi:hypothetical protein